MTNVLIINSSVAGANSVSKGLTAAFKASLLVANPEAMVVECDLSAEPLVHLSDSNIAGFFGSPDASIESQIMATQSEAAILDLEAADLIVIGSPMYNFGISTLLKSWFDYVIRAGRTFKYTEHGPVGLLSGKKIIVIATRGGLYSEGPGAASNFQDGHIKALFKLMGLTDVTLVVAEGMAFGPEAKAAAIDKATLALAELASKTY
jgi:FMN-dependent NADH-azoreductase